MSLETSARTLAMTIAVEEAKDFSREAMSNCNDILLEAELQLQQMHQQMDLLKPKTVQVAQHMTCQHKSFFDLRNKRNLRMQRQVLSSAPQFNRNFINEQP